ncbi:MAG: hypothetical protein ABI666_01815 [Ferruginibacter sp.]
MTNEMKRNFDNHSSLTIKALDDLKEKGYKYLQVQGFTMDHHPEYIEPYYLMLVPVKSLTANKAAMDVYEEISGETIINWAKRSDDESLHIFLANTN